MINTLKAKIEAASLRARHEISDDFLDNVIERRTRRLRRTPCFVFSEREELFQQMSGAPNSCFQRSHAFTSFLRHFHAIEIFGLETKRRDRRSKLVCCIRNESALLIKHGTD